MRMRMDTPPNTGGLKRERRVEWRMASPQKQTAGSCWQRQRTTNGSRKRQSGKRVALLRVLLEVPVAAINRG